MLLANIVLQPLRAHTRSQRLISYRILGLRIIECNGIRLGKSEIERLCRCICVFHVLLACAAGLAIDYISTVRWYQNKAGIFYGRIERMVAELKAADLFEIVENGNGI